MNPNNLIKHGHKVVKSLCSGAIETGHCGIDALDKTKNLVAKSQKGSCACYRSFYWFSMWVAMGLKKKVGSVIGFSPANE